jgi:hypothetical protein
MSKLNSRYLAALCLLLSAAALSAQSSRGTLSGIVRDSSGAGIPGATIVLTDTDRKTTRESATTDAGIYRFDAVDLGTYRIEIKKTGFQTFAASNITINAAAAVTVDAKLELGQQSTVVEVSSDSVQLQVEQPVRGSTVTAIQSTELPIASRNATLLALNLPGVSSNRGGFGINTFSVNGGRGRSNNFMLDGTENNDISINGQAFQVTNSDAVQEVSVQTANFDSEFGRAGGAVINMIIKSGTDQLHGSASYLLESTRLNAITNTQALSSYVQANQKPIPGTDQWFSGSLGGPIRKGKTFFFGAFQERRTVSQGTVNLISPTAAGRATIRSLIPSGVNPTLDTYLAATASSAGTSQFSNIALGGGRPDVQIGTFIRTVPSKLRNFQPLVKVDHRFNDNDSLSVRYAYDQTVDPLGGGTNFEGFDTSSKSRYQNIALTETHVFNPTMTNEFRLPYNRITFDFPVDATNALGNTLPNISIQGVTALGVATNIPQGRIANNYGLQDTITKIAGRHTIRVGVDLLLQRSRQIAPSTIRGSISYLASTGFTGLGNFVDGFSGNQAVASRDFGNATYYPDLFRQAYFVQDRWRITDSLTLSAGLRYEYFGLPMNSLRTPAYAGIFNLNTTTFDGPYSLPNQVNGDRNNFSPNIGLAYSPKFDSGILGRLFGNGKSSIRAGYGIGYESFFNNIASNAVASTPNLLSTQFNALATNDNPRGVANFITQIPTTARAANALDAQTLIDPNLRNPYYQRFNFSVQRQLKGGFLLDLAYVGSRGVKLFLNEDLNPLVPANRRVFPQGTTAASFPANRLQQRFDPLQGPRTIRTNGGSSTYHSFQAEVKRSFRNGFAFTGAYTWSKFIDNGSEIFAFGGGLNIPSLAQTPSPFGGQPSERSLSAFDRDHRAVFSYIYNLPFGKQQNNLLNRVIGGWQISGVSTFEAGVPFTISNGLDADGFGGAGNDRPDFNPSGRPGVRAQISATSPTGYINPEANNAPIAASDAMFIQRAACTSADGCRPGNLGRNTQRSPGINNWNANFQKDTAITERVRVQLRGEFFNLFNRPQYGVASSSAFAPALGTLGANAQATLGGRFLNPVFQDGGGRVVRFQLKVLF